MPYIFERFYKEDKSRGVYAAGSGLGMHISKVLITRSGGEIKVESIPNELTKFYFTLPKANHSASTKRKKANMSPKE